MIPIRPRRSRIGEFVFSGALLLLAAGGSRGAALPSDPALPEFRGDEAKHWVVRQCALGPRVPGSTAHQAWLELVSAYLDSLGHPALRQTFSHPSPMGKDTLRLTNLFVQFRPEVRPRLLLGAHWDSRPWSDRESDATLRNRPISGANDGASGVAVLLVLARMFAQAPPPLGVDLAFFDGEDLGREDHLAEYCLGSQWMAAQWSGPLPDWAVILDMVGADNVQIGREQYSQNMAPRLLDLVFQLARDRGISEFDPAGSQLIVDDDHIPFQTKGVEAIVLIGFNDPAWHTQRDVPSHVSPVSLGHVGTVIRDLVYGGHLVP